MVIKQKKKYKYALYIFFTFFCFFAFNNDIYAFDEYGIYCEYNDFYFKYSGFHNSDLFEFDTNFDQLGVAIEDGRPGKIITDSSEQEWLKSKGLITTVGSNSMFTCPENPFGTTLGQPTYKEYGKNNGLIDKIEAIEESYSCNYVGVDSNKRIDVTYTYSTQNGKSIMINYPNGNTETLTTNSQFMGNTFPSEECEDIYFIYSDNTIHSTIYNNSISNSNNAMLYQLCQKYSQDDIEHFCSGTCNYEEMVCSSSTVDWEKIDENCEGIIGQDMIDFLNKIFGWIQILAPIIVIILGGVDLAGAVLQDDKDALKKATSKFIKRLIIAVVIFFIPIVLDFLLNVFNEASGAGSSTCNLGR